MLVSAVYAVLRRAKGYWILTGCYPYFIQHQASSVQYQLVKWHRWLKF